MVVGHKILTVFLQYKNIPTTMVKIQSEFADIVRILMTFWQGVNCHYIFLICENSTVFLFPACARAQETRKELREFRAKTTKLQTKKVDFDAIKEILKEGILTFAKL